MSSAIFEWVIVLVAAWLVRLIVSRLIPGPSQSAEPGDFEGSPARLRPRPKRGAGVVVLVEPAEEEDEAT